MLFGKKEDSSKLPDLPPLPRSPGGNSMQMSGPSFPDLPPLPQGNPSSQEMGNMIQPPGRRDVVMSPPPMRQEPQRPKVVEMEEWHPSSRPMEDVEEEIMEEPMPVPQPRYTMNRPQPMMRQQAVEDVFVRIDKFHSARKSLSEIQSRLGDIDELVKRIRDTKMREEQELAGWERELMNIKARVANVTETIFEKVE